MTNETLVEAIAGCISKHMREATYPADILAAAREIANKYAAAPAQAEPDRCARCKGGLNLPNKKCPAGKHDCTVYPA